MPLGPPVILTQEPEDNAKLSARLSALQIMTLDYPCIATRYLDFDVAQPVNGRPLADYSVVAFTSKRGVIGAQPLRELIARSRPAIACVGPATAREAEARLGVTCTILPASDQTASGLAAAILTAFVLPASILHLRGATVSGALKEILVQQGWDFGELIVYVNEAPGLAPIKLDERAIAVFASPSAAQRFTEVNGRLREKVRAVAVGAVTAQCLNSLGFAQVIIAQQPDVEGLLEAVKEAVMQEVHSA